MDAYSEKTNDKGETRVILKLSPQLAPIKAAILPLAKNKPEIVGMAKAIKRSLQPVLRAVYDDTGGIGKLYARQDEIGTPFCVTVRPPVARRRSGDGARSRYVGTGTSESRRSRGTFTEAFEAVSGCQRLKPNLSFMPVVKKRNQQTETRLLLSRTTRSNCRPLKSTIVRCWSSLKSSSLTFLNCWKLSALERSLSRCR